jgi:uncharacterized membrane protein YozB (DUF420 family)
MPEPSTMATVITVGLIPIAFLFVYTYLSGKKGWRYHKLTGIVAISWDLTMSMGYMIWSIIGEDESTLELSGGVLAYFIIHGTIAVAVIILELVTLFLGIMKWKEKEIGRLHSKVSTILFFIWWFAFLSGEVFYLVYYIV